MQLDKYLKDNIILIVPENAQEKIIKYISSLPEMYSIKVMTFTEIKKELLFDYDTRTIHYIMKNNQISYENALELINNMYYLFDDNYDNKKIDNLNNLKKDLITNDLLIINPFFKESLKGKEIVVYGFDYINKYYLKLIDILKEKTKVTILNKTKNNYTPTIYKFNNINNEIEFIANDILNKKIPFNKVFIYGLNKDNIHTFKRVFNNYHIPVNYQNEISLYETDIGVDLLNNLNDIDTYLNSVSNEELKKQLIDIINNYYWEPIKENIKDMLIYELKNTYIKEPRYKEAINITNLLNDCFYNDDYIYIINFNNEYIPAIYKDTDFICDEEKFSFLETSIEKNAIEEENWKNILNSTNNLTITYSNNNLNGPLTESSLVNDCNLKVNDFDYKPSNYSNNSNLYNMAILLDNYRNNNGENDYIKDLLATYPDNLYLSYDNKYTGINYKEKYNLSYSKMNTFYECPFKYYCDNILKLNEYEDTFDTFVGSLVHYILSKMDLDDFDFEKSKNEFIDNHPFDLSDSNVFFTNKILDELKFVIRHLQSFKNISKYQNVESEKRIITKIKDVDFIGIVDKVLSYEDNYVLIDFKTGNPDIDLRLAKYGLNLQLPTYIYLIKSINPKSNIVGIYLEHILKPIFNNDKNNSTTKQYEDALKFIGYSLGNEEKLKDFDPTYENSDFIKGLKLTSNGFSANSKVLTKKEFNKLSYLVEEKITECINQINNASFNIDPKIVDGDNISCKYCKYHSVCFKTEKDYKYITLDQDLLILGGDEDELD